MNERFLLKQPVFHGKSAGFVFHGSCGNSSSPFSLAVKANYHGVIALDNLAGQGGP